MKAVFKTTGGKDPVKDSIASYSAGEVIFHQGDLGTDMFIIQEGEVHIIKNINGASHVLSKLEKGDFFGEMSVLESLPRTADAIAITDVKTVIINGARFDDMLRKNPEVAVRIIRSIRNDCARPTRCSNGWSAAKSTPIKPRSSRRTSRRRNADVFAWSTSPAAHRFSSAEGMRRRSDVRIL